MTPAARVQAGMDLLDRIIAAAHGQGAPADRIVAEWFRTHRFAGSKDKRAIRELVYAAIRACGPLPQNGRAAMLRLAQAQPEIAEAFDGSRYGPEPIRPEELVAQGGIAPDWLVERLAASGVEGDEAAALLERAPLDIRVNALRARRETVELPRPGEPLPAPQGLRYAAGTPVEQWPAFSEGLIEVQDGGSQLVCQAIGARPGETVIDLCAGAGGKTLALGAAMENQGTLIAADTDRGRLSRLEPRAHRAGVRVAETILLDPGRELAALDRWAERADRVLVDAPCSGTGTWRRNPEARWRLSPVELGRLTQLQARLLDIAARLTRPGGRLVYITCSLLDEEGTEQVEAFLGRHPGWQCERPAMPAGRPRGSGLRLSPLHDRTDGFFIACLNKPC